MIENSKKTFFAYFWTAAPTLPCEREEIEKHILNPNLRELQKGPTDH